VLYSRRVERRAPAALVVDYRHRVSMGRRQVQAGTRPRG
jgi:hypothetical protein